MENQKSLKKITNLLKELVYLPVNFIEQLKEEANHSFARFTSTYKKIQMDQFQINQQELIQKNDPLRSSMKYSTYIPIIIESYIWLYSIYAFYVILKAIVLIPIDFLVGIFNFVLETFRFYRSKYLTTHSILIILGVLIVTRDFDFFDISVMYHLLRGQSAVKLYALIFALENGQKLFTKVGKFLFKNVREKIQYNKFYSLSVLPQFLASLTYVILHSYIIFIDFIVYTVVLNSTMQNFIVFWSAIYLTRMKSMPFQKFDQNQYKSILSQDSKYRLSRILYLIIFQLSQIQRQIPSFSYKLIFIIFVQQAFELGKHTLNLVSGDKDRNSLKVRQKMYKNLYLEKSNGSIQRCIGQNFTVLPFVVFSLKMLKIMVQTNYCGSLFEYIRIYLICLFLMVFFRLIVIFTGKFVNLMKMVRRNSRIIRSLSIISIQEKNEEMTQKSKKKNQ